jgi:(p)ppGpp synthase/HD superfamily hydrolase
VTTPAQEIADRRGAIAAASYERRRTALRRWLAGRGYHHALEAMTYAESLHTGLRRDGLTPEFDHQIRIVSYLVTLHPHLRYPQETYSVGFLHDVAEDYGVSGDELRERFGDRVADGVLAMTKEWRGVKRDAGEVARVQAENPVASIVKGVDRMHNHNTMVGVFTPERIASYVTETRTSIMPMLKRARTLHPYQDGAYQNVRAVLRTQLELLDFVVATE